MMMIRRPLRSMEIDVLDVILIVFISDADLVDMNVTEVVQPTGRLAMKKIYMRCLILCRHVDYMAWITVLCETTEFLRLIELGSRFVVKYAHKQGTCV